MVGFVIVPTTPFCESYAEKLAEDLKDLGCEIDFNYGYGCDIVSRMYGRYDHVIMISESEVSGKRIRLVYRPEDKSQTLHKQQFLKNHESYLY